MKGGVTALSGEGGAAASDDGGILDGLPVAVLRVRSDGLVEYANRCAREVLGRDPSGKDVGQLLAPLPRLMAGGGPGTSDLRASIAVRDEAGQDRRYGFQLSPMDSRGRVLLVFQDITRVEQLRAERDRLMQMAAVGSVLPSLLHEIKNPLAAITAAVEVLVEEAPPGELQDRLHGVLQESRRMALTLEGVGRVQREARSARAHPIDHAVSEACLVLEPKALSKKVALRAEVPTMPLLPFDPATIRAVVFNLVMNAINATPAGGEVVVSARLDSAPGAFRLKVVDNGQGMEPEVLARCRELFFTTRANGSGIGLALCSNIAEGAGGTLSVESTRGAGTSVELMLPLYLPETR